ncbi:MAG: signal peptide peptidase SppA [Pseudomonadota bacterium]|nr:signal peptide peptidase SppA [Pseudomonadota bacterium]
MTKDEMKQLAEKVAAIGRRDIWHKRWRNLALVLIAIALFNIFSTPAPVVDKSHIAVINIDEPISQNSLFWEQFERISNKDTKAALILMNSPGGTVGDSERLYNQIRDIQEMMPVALLVENSATSGGYLASLAANRIYAYNSAVIGSIGVIFRSWIARDVYDMIGLKLEQITTGSHKGYPSSYEEMPDDVKKNLTRMLEADNNWFLDLVIQRRNVGRDTITAIQEAQVYNAKDALALGLIDGISNRSDQIRSLYDQVGVLPLKDMSVDEDDVLGISKLLKPQRKSMGKLISRLLLGAESPVIG